MKNNIILGEMTNEIVLVQLNYQIDSQLRSPAFRKLYHPHVRPLSDQLCPRIYHPLYDQIFNQLTTQFYRQSRKDEVLL